VPQSTPTSRAPDGRGLSTPAAPKSRSGLKRGLSRTAAVASCLACGLLALPAVSSATVAQTTAQWAELGSLAYTSTPVLSQQSQQDVTAVYAISSSASSSNLLEDHGNQMSDGAVTDVWGQVNQATDQDSYSSNKITQANQLWEFVPRSDNSGGSITTGYGQLINRQSGLCLDINGANTGDGATVDQWQCVPGANNEEWRAEGSDGVYALMSANVPATSLSTPVQVLGIGNGPTCDATGDGQRVYARTIGNFNACDDWTIQQASYDFATYPIGLPISGGQQSGNTDNRSYGCVNGYDLRYYSFDANDDLNHSGDDDSQTIDPVWSWDYDNVGTSHATPQDVMSSILGTNPVSGLPGITPGESYSNPQELVGGFLWYTASVSGQTGQVMLYCDPPSTTT